MPLPSRRDRWKLWNWRVRTKLFAVLLVPAVAAGVLGSVQVSNELRGVQDLGKTVRQVELGVLSADLVHEVQHERALMAGYVAVGRQGDRSTLDIQKRRVDGMASSVRLASGRLQGLDTLVQDRYRQAVNALNGLTALRQVAETTRFSDESVVIAYTALINSLLELSREIARATNARDVADIAGAADALGRAKEQVAQQHAIMLVAILHNQIEPSQVQELRVADSRFGAAVAEFRSVARPADRQRYDDTVTGPEVDDRERIKLTVLQASATGEQLGMGVEDVAAWDRASGRTTDLINKVQTGLLGQLRGGAVALREKAGADAVRDATILLGSLLVTLLLVVVVARSMLVPLRVLRNTAFDVADRRLPQAIRRMRDAEGDVPDVSVAPVAVHTREEIGQVARAFDAVHGEAVRLAAEQALLRRNVNDMFVNLSRRSQGLVERQLRLIDQLENKEQDPEQLSNLFQLDHLATRMRRNSENLLVLAGADLARRSARPIAAVDVLRAAVSEVEEYQRVVVQPPPPVSVLGMAVNDIVHLVAELLDNATTFSPPHTRVLVGSHLSGHGELVVEISDQGVGMSEAQLAEANQRLADPPVVDVSVSRRMGLFVVGRLAMRHGISVRLAANSDEENGLTATVVVPNELVQTGELDTIALPAAGEDVPAPRTGEELLADRQQRVSGSRISESLAGSSHDDDYLPANWPDTDVDGRPVQPAPAEPAPYEVGVTAPMQVTMVDAMSGPDLFTPASVPTYSQPTDPELTAVDNHADLYGDRFAGDYYRDEPSPSAWPDTDQDVELGGAAPAVTHFSAMSNSVPPGQEQEPAAEDFLGVSEQVAMARTAGAVETTPIYEEMVSAWFRETVSSTVPPAAPSVPAAVDADRPPAAPALDVPAVPVAEAPAAPVMQQPRKPATPHRPRHAAPTEEPVPPAAAPPAATPAPEPAREYRRSSKPMSRPPAAKPPMEPARPEPTRPAPAPSQPEAPRLEPAPVAASSSEWSSPADEGWLAAGALLTPANNGFTAAGLPKRRKGAHLVPGAAAPPPASTTSARPTIRSADSVRGRLASYQQGLRQGRDARRDLAHASLEHGAEPAGQQSTSEERQ
jgi:signal transduction histidine kinase